MKKYLATISLSIILSFVFVQNASAAVAPNKGGTYPTVTVTPTPTTIKVTPTSQPVTNCQPIYGGGETCKQSDKVSVEKKVMHPQTLQYVDNIGINDPKYKLGNEVKFQVIVTNSGNTVLKNVTLTDTMPAEVTYLSASVPFSITNNVLSYTISELQPNATITVEITGRINDNQAEGIACPINRASAVVNNETDEDIAQFCIQKDVATAMPMKDMPKKEIPTQTKGGQPVYPAPTTVESTPKSGPETLALIGLIPSAVAGFALRRKTK